jgi:MFS family permease
MICARRRGNYLSAVADQRTELTYRYEQWRALSSGILESAGTTFLLLIAVRWFHAGEDPKALVAAGGSFGLLLSPLVVSFVERRGIPTTQAAARIAVVGALSFSIAAIFPILPVFVLCSIVAMACSSAAIPLMTQVYQDNYPEQERGRRFSRTLIIRIAATALFSELAGRALTGNMEFFRTLLVIFAVAFALGSYCLKRIPSRALTGSGHTHPLRALRFAWSDPIFRITLSSWMLLGFGTLMMHPLRVEYLANPKYGHFYTAGAIALLTGVIPNMVRLVLSPVWGWLFDHVNFFALRVTLNVGFALGVLAFFLSDSFDGFVLGAIIFGISNAGGDVAWSLWVTKFAPPDRVADYMSAHTFFTGLRGVIAPIVAFQLIKGGVSLTVLGWISAALIFSAALLLLPEIKSAGRPRGTSPVVEEVSE